MALPNLASTADLAARGVEADALAGVMLGVASSLVREAAGSPVASHSATVTFYATERDPYLEIPTRPVTAVSAVAIDGESVTDYKLVDGSLWRRSGWFTHEPAQVEVSLTCGLPEVPASIVQLVCDLAILGMDTATDGAVDPRAVTESIDDYSVTFTQGASDVASAMTIPTATRSALRARFGGGVGSTRMR